MADVTDTYYPATDAIHGYGFQIMVASEGASPQTWQAIAGAREFTPGAMNTADIDSTHARSPAAHREHRAGMRDSAAISCRLIWLPNDESQSNAGGGTGPYTDGGLVAIWRSRKARDFKLVVLAEGTSPGLEWPFRAYVSQFQPGSVTAENQVVEATASFQPTEAYDTNLP